MFEVFKEDCRVCIDFDTIGWRFCTSFRSPKGSWGTVTPAELHAHIRGHWQVENCLHFIKDRWWDEDRHYTKRPGLAESFASLTNAGTENGTFLIS